MNLQSWSYKNADEKISDTILELSQLREALFTLPLISNTLRNIIEKK